MRIEEGDEVVAIEDAVTTKREYKVEKGYRDIIEGCIHKTGKTLIWFKNHNGIFNAEDFIVSKYKPGFAVRELYIGLVIPYMVLDKWCRSEKNNFYFANYKEIGWRKHDSGFGVEDRAVLNMDKVIDREDCFLVSGCSEGVYIKQTGFLEFWEQEERNKQ